MDTNEEDDDEGSVFINRHKIETEKQKSNYLFEASRLCGGIYQNTYKKGVKYPKKILQSLDKFLSKLESKYGFYIEHYVKNPSPINYLRLFTIEDYLNSILVENGISLLDENDSIWLKALASYTKINWYTADNRLFIRAINHELLSKISLYLDNRNIFDKGYKNDSYDLVVYSGHDSSMLFFMMALGLNNLKCLEKIILKVEKGESLNSKLLNSCLYSVEFAQDLRIELVEKDGKMLVVMRRGNVYYKIPNPSGWSTVKVCGKDNF
jgi:hypothetical protein